MSEGDDEVKMFIVVVFCCAVAAYLAATAAGADHPVLSVVVGTIVGGTIWLITRRRR